MRHVAQHAAGAVLEGYLVGMAGGFGGFRLHSTGMLQGSARGNCDNDIRDHDIYDYDTHHSARDPLLPMRSCIKLSPSMRDWRWAKLHHQFDGLDGLLLRWRKTTTFEQFEPPGEQQETAT